MSVLCVDDRLTPRGRRTIHPKGIVSSAAQPSLICGVGWLLSAMPLHSDVVERESNDAGAEMHITTADVQEMSL